MIFRRSSSSRSHLPREAAQEGSENSQILAYAAMEYMKERKIRRRWGLFFKLFFVGYLILIAYWMFQDSNPDILEPHTALISIDGVIGLEEYSSHNIIDSLGAAFESENARGIILAINSPGGTPVQAARINEEILRLRARYPGKPFHVVIGDICASGGYYIAVAAERIHAHPSSLVGSIGVILNGFGFTGAMEKLGIERRLVHSGDNKSMLDPFSPVQPEHYRHVQAMVDDVHDQFIQAVKDGRSGRLADDPDIFSGLVWSGRKARELGLIDDFGSVGGVARDVIGEELLVDYTKYPGVFEQVRREIGVSISDLLSIGAPRFQ
ncbi:MAG: signal peptide peptidase SppA [Gammaproteobacteria bacterium]|nr:signal peptide peptidase SppA [Gammaproteobacteria bacterium]MYD75078.1 signal peptide peptidase SppA [Gammaproteobacteria bacterium]